MVKIKLSRVGRKNYPSYKIVVSEAGQKRESYFIEFLGHYSPITKEIVLKEDRARYWISVGAQPTDTVRGILIKKGILQQLAFKKVFTKPPKKKSTERKNKNEGGSEE